MVSIGRRAMAYAITALSLPPEFPRHSSRDIAQSIYSARRRFGLLATRPRTQWRTDYGADDSPPSKLSAATLGSAFCVRRRDKRWDAAYDGRPIRGGHALTSIGDVAGFACSNEVASFAADECR